MNSMALIAFVIILGTSGRPMSSRRICCGVMQDKGADLSSSYSVVSNNVFRADNPELAHRRMTVLLDPEAFTKEDLKHLFSRLLKGYPDPDWITVNVYTTFEQIRAATANGPSDGKQPPYTCGRGEALFSRHAGVQSLKYTPHLEDCKMEKIILDGDSQH